MTILLLTKMATTRETEWIYCKITVFCLFVTAFVLHRGRAQLTLDTDVVRCKLVSYQNPQFLPQYKVMQLNVTVIVHYGCRLRNML